MAAGTAIGASASLAAIGYQAVTGDPDPAETSLRIERMTAEQRFERQRTGNAKPDAEEALMQARFAGHERERALTKQDADADTSEAPGRETAAQTPAEVKTLEQHAAQQEEVPAQAPLTVLPVTWLLWPTGECLYVSRTGSCDERPAVSEVGWAAPRFDGPPWFEDGRPLGSFDIEFEPLYLQRVTPDGTAAP